MFKSRKFILSVSPYQLRWARVKKDALEYLTWWADRLQYSKIKADELAYKRNQHRAREVSKEVYTNSSVIGVLIGRISSIAEHYNRKLDDLVLWGYIQKTLTGVGNSKDLDITVKLMAQNDPQVFLETMALTGDITDAMKSFYGEYRADRYPCWNVHVSFKDGDVVIKSK